MGSRYFSDDEIKCSHCGAMPPDTQQHRAFLLRLDTLRASYGFPLVVSSFFRCAQHPDEVNKPHGPGAHNSGVAVDLRVSRHNAWRLLKLAFAMDCFPGVGVKQKGSTEGRFIHLDAMADRADAPRPSVWSY